MGCRACNVRRGKECFSHDFRIGLPEHGRHNCQTSPRHAAPPSNWLLVLFDNCSYVEVWKVTHEFRRRKL